MLEAATRGRMMPNEPTLSNDIDVNVAVDEPIFDYQSPLGAHQLGRCSDFWLSPTGCPIECRRVGQEQMCAAAWDQVPGAGHSHASLKQPFQKSNQMQATSSRIKVRRG